MDFSANTQLKAARARSTAGAFDQFLENEIGIGMGTRGRASTSQNALRDRLRSQAAGDSTFPRILRDADSDFLGGSFARHTKIWPLNDIDAYFPIDAQGLVYMKGGMRAPYTALSDDVMDENPLFLDRDRWWEGSYISSKKLIDGFADVLRDHYPSTTRVRAGGEAVMVTLSNELGFDVVPCFSLKPQNTWEPSFYLIPDGSDGWIQTNPRLDKDMSDRLHRANNRTLRRGVKLFKWWANEYLGARVASYYIELAIMRAFDHHNSFGQLISTVPEATYVAFKAVSDALQLGDIAPILTGSPKVEPGNATSRDLQILNTDVEDCRLALAFDRSGQVDEALATWKKVFGSKFPAD